MTDTKDTRPALTTAADAAALIERKAEDYANQFGYGVGGTLCFDRQEKMDHYTTLTELAEEIRAMASNAASAPPVAIPALAAQVAGNFDDYVVEQFAVVMKRKLAAARDKGRGGWNYCSAEDLSRMLREHVEKGDPRDVANFCMFLWYHGQPIHAHQNEVRAENTAAVAATSAANGQRAQTIARAIAAHGRKWPEQLTSGVMFYEGERITKADFLAEAQRDPD